MASIKEYLKETANFNKRIELITEFLSNSSFVLNELIKKLEYLFDSLRRGNNLLNFLKNYAETFKSQLIKLGEELDEIKEEIVFYQNRLSEIDENISQIRATADNIESNVHSFIKLARMITYLAENIEVKAHQAKNEGRGLAVIARETHKIASSSQVLFRGFDELLEVIRRNVEPFSSDIQQTLIEASTSVKEVTDIPSSLRTLSDSVELLQKFINSTERSSELFLQLEEKIKEKVEIIRKQFVEAQSTVDEISTRGSEIAGLSRILYELHNIANLLYKSTGTDYQINQFKHIVSENIKILDKIRVGIRPVLLSAELAGEIEHIIGQVKELYEQVITSQNEIEKLDMIMKRVSTLRLDLNQIFSHRNLISDKIKEFTRILKEQLTFIEELITTGTKIIMRLRTLAIFARLERSHSFEYEASITPIVLEFNSLLDRMVSSFNTLYSETVNLKNILGRLGTLYLPRDFTQITVPDFSRIKVFFDDTLRVFEDCLGCIRDLRNVKERLDKENFLLNHYWNVYEDSLKAIINFKSLLRNLLSDFKTAPSVVKTKKKLGINLFNDPVTLKPDLKTDATSQQVIVNYSTGLFQFGVGTEVIPGLCAEYSISEDSCEYIFHIREGLKYANGRKVNIEDIKNGIIRGLNGPNRNLLEMISGAREYLKLKEEKSLHIKVLDSYRLNVRLEYPYLPFIASFATGIADPYIDDDLPVGTGPFRLTMWERGKELILEANEFFYEGRPAVDVLKFVITADDEFGYELFKNGELSLFQPGSKSLRWIKQECPELLVTYPDLSIHFLCFHCQKPPFNNKLVRQAISHAIDRERMVKELLSDIAIPAKGVFPPSASVYNHQLTGYRFDPSMSRELLERAGFTAGLPDTYPLVVS
ncbi:MAG: ABC transporter substrate-binding protein, partial [candidate division WOR-3 bacterium]|nr:ABC transporter substrate-binding protein [candidate division WOR-3 bacterium]